MKESNEFLKGEFIWDAHAGFESRPDARLEQLETWCNAGFSYLSVNEASDVCKYKEIH